MVHVIHEDVQNIVQPFIIVVTVLPQSRKTLRHNLGQAPTVDAHL